MLTLPVSYDGHTALLLLGEMTRDVPCVTQPGHADNLCFNRFVKAPAVHL